MFLLRNIIVWIFYGASIYATESFEFEPLTTTDNLTISLGRYTGEGARPNADKKMLVLPGKTCIPNWKHFIAKRLSALGFDVYVLDFRGQGKSTRLTENPQMFHLIGSFDNYLLDVQAAVNKLNHEKKQPLYLYGFSMGGLVGLSYVQEHNSVVTKAIFEAPMTGINTSPFSQPLARVIFLNL